MVIHSVLLKLQNLQSLVKQPVFTKLYHKLYIFNVNITLFFDQLPDKGNKLNILMEVGISLEEIAKFDIKSNMRN